MQYWKTHQKALILEHLETALKDKTTIVVWQQFGDHRKTFPARLIEISRANCKVKLDQNAPTDLFTDEAPFYVHIKELDIIFKKENFNRLGAFIEFSPPGEIQIYEKRKTKRFYYLYQDHKNITYHSQQIDPSTQSPIFTLSSVLVDISTQGAGMVVGQDIVNKLEVNQILFLDNLTDQKLPSPFKVRIIYIQKYKETEEELYKVGLIFTDQLNSISYKSISSIIEVKQRKTQGITSKKYCGLDLEEQIKILNHVEKSNKVLCNNLKDNIEYLDQLRYMTTQMKIEFLKEVNHNLLAVALRLSSKELIYELLSELTITMQDEFLDKLQTEKPASAVCKAQDEIIKLVREKERTGEIVLDPKAFITYV